MELELQLWKCNCVIPLLFVAHFLTPSPGRELPQHMRGRCCATLSLADGKLNKYLPAYYYVLLATPARTVRTCPIRHHPRTVIFGLTSFLTSSRLRVVTPTPAHNKWGFGTAQLDRHFFSYFRIFPVSRKIWGLQNRAQKWNWVSGSHSKKIITIFLIEKPAK